MATATKSGAGAVLSFRRAAADLDVSLSTFRRAILPHIAVVRLSARRLGVTEQAVEQFKEARTRPPARRSGSGP
jgi:hypothetical protein